MVVGHNFADYDRGVMLNLANVDIQKERIVDTVIMSRKLCNLKNNKLETWGTILGLPKLPQPRFDIYTPEMDTYCERDVRLNSAAFGFMYRLWHSRADDFDQNITAILIKYEAELQKSFVNWG
jgi:hypothetical protein